VSCNRESTGFAGCDDKFERDRAPQLVTFSFGATAQICELLVQYLSFLWCFGSTGQVVVLLAAAAFCISEVAQVQAGRLLARASADRWQTLGVLARHQMSCAVKTTLDSLQTLFATMVSS
jgi:hypothetical protein